MSPARTLAAAALLLVLLDGCRFDRAGINTDAEAGACPGRVCACIDADECAPSCAFDRCELTCQRLEACLADCGDDCRTTAEAAERVELTCGDGCQARCAAVGACEVTCGVDCRVECTDVGTCRVTLRAGEVLCERTGRCEVACAGVDGVPREAEERDDGVRACEDRLTPG